MASGVIDSSTATITESLPLTGHSGFCSPHVRLRHTITTSRKSTTAATRKRRAHISSPFFILTLGWMSPTSPSLAGQTPSNALRADEGKSVKTITSFFSAPHIAFGARTYVCTSSRAHARKYARADETSTRRKRLPYFASSDATPKSALQEQIRAWRQARNASLR